MHWDSITMTALGGSANRFAILVAVGSSMPGRTAVIVDLQIRKQSMCQRRGVPDPCLHGFWIPFAGDCPRDSAVAGG